MVYRCEGCGTWFKKSQLIAPDGRMETIVQCEVCPVSTRIKEYKETHVARGYDFLENAHFSSAITEFNRKLQEDRNRNTSSVDAYIGLALAKYEVQTVYEDDDKIANKDIPPEMTCYKYNRMLFEDSSEYRSAKEIIAQIQDESLQESELRRLENFRDYIDGVKAAYDEMARQRIKYQLFLAYDDRSARPEDGLLKAVKLMNKMPDGIRRVFIPNMEDSKNDPIKYEARILYALYNSNAMLALIDGNVGNRLMDMYSRYETAIDTTASKSSLGFVCYRGVVPIHTKNHEHSVDHNVFRYMHAEDLKPIVKFVCGFNGVIAGTEEVITVSPPQPEPKNPETVSAAASMAPVVDGSNQIQFGHYPQKAEKNKAIENYFRRFGKPDETDAKGWTPLFYRKTDGKPYTWFRDEVIKEKKYRGIYFSQYREIMTVRDSDMIPSIQRIEKYYPEQFHIFRFAPIYWNIVERIEAPYKRYTLIPSMSLDTQPFNDREQSGAWDVSTLRLWLNSVFLQTAFSEEEREYLNVLGTERVFLLDEGMDLGNTRIMAAVLNANLGATDYFRCLGGKVDRGLVSRFWIRTENCDGDEAKVLYPHDKGNISHVSCDNSSVAVVPKIYVNIK